MSESHLDFYRRWNKLAKPYFKWQLEQFKPYLGSRIADVGCGLGNFTQFLTDKEFYIGIDSDPELTKEFNRTYTSFPNIKIINNDILLPECCESLKRFQINSILAVNVIEHIENDVLAINNMVNALPSGGALCLLVPAMPWLYGTLDHLDGHFRRYTKKMLSKKLKEFPLKIERMYYFNFIGAFGWFWKGRIIKENRQADENYRLMNLLVPVVSRIEKINPPPFGLSLIAVARRG